MRKIIDDRITDLEHGYSAMCQCGEVRVFSSKDSALNMLRRGSCQLCMVNYKSKIESKFPIHKNSEGKWCSNCSKCGVEQAYTRKDHAIQSSRQHWMCKKCVAASRGFSANTHVGGIVRLYRKFHNGSLNRGIYWDLSISDFEKAFVGKCALTGWDITIAYNECNASLDRIDNNKGYTKDNIQWVHSMVNMSKNKYPNDVFIKMCVDVANNLKKKQP